MMTNKALLCELTATLRQMDWNNTKTAWKTSHVKAKQLYQTIRPFWWRSYYLDFRLHIWWISLYAEPNKTQDTSPCEVMHFNNHFYFRPPGFETAQFCLQNKDAISYQTFTGHALINIVKIQSISNDKEIETAICQADLMILSMTFKLFKNIISFIMHLKDTHINDRHNKMWNNSDMFTPSIFWFSCCPK